MVSIGQTNMEHEAGSSAPVPALTSTPWGPAEELRARKLSPGPSNSRDAVARNQRERLFGAMVAVVAKQGYERTRVADILGLAGISRSAFYKHFQNKHECFLATLDALVADAAWVVSKADLGGLPWEERLRTVFDAVIAMILNQPAAARVWFVEIYSAGPEAVARAERMGDALERLAADALRGTPDRADMPSELIRAVLGGLRQIVQTRLRHERQHELPSLVPDLLAWALSYRIPQARLRRPRKPPPLPQANPDPSEQRERIIAAVTEIVAEKGYVGMTITEIAQRAAISLSTFYAHFESKTDVFIAAIDDGERRLLETTLPVYRQATDWESAVHDGLHAFFAFLTRNTATARLGGVDIFTAGALALERHERSVQGFQMLLQPGYDAHPATNPLAAEAVGGAIAALMYQQLRRKGPERLYQVAPTATFLALAPFTGTERACEVANEDWRPTKRPAGRG